MYGKEPKIPSKYWKWYKIILHLPIGSKITFSPTIDFKISLLSIFWFKLDHLFNGFKFKQFQFFLKYVALNYLL